MHKRVLAMGDIHGMYEKLLSVMEQMKYNPDDERRIK